MVFTGQVRIEEEEYAKPSEFRNYYVRENTYMKE